MIYIFSYQRKEMLLNLIDELRHHEFTIIDDGSDFKLNLSNFHQFEHKGKEQFYLLWQYALKEASNNKDNLFMFIPSDFQRIDLNNIFRYYNMLNHEPFVCNIINDGRKSCWNLHQPKPYNEELNQVFFTDCGFFCNRSALEKINFTIPSIDKNRFIYNKNISSGVGQSFTNLFNKEKVKIFTPINSLAYHGNHDSLMHKKERIIRPLISK